MRQNLLGGGAAGVSNGDDSNASVRCIGLAAAASANSRSSAGSILWNEGCGGGSGALPAISSVRSNTSSASGAAGLISASEVARRGPPASRRYRPDCCSRRGLERQEEARLSPRPPVRLESLTGECRSSQAASLPAARQRAFPAWPAALESVALGASRPPQLCVSGLGFSRLASSSAMMRRIDARISLHRGLLELGWLASSPIPPHQRPHMRFTPSRTGFAGSGYAVGIFISQARLVPRSTPPDTSCGICPCPGQRSVAALWCQREVRIALLPMATVRQGNK